MQNKPNLRNDKMNTTLDMTSIYMILSAGSGQKTKPIQTQFKPNKAKNKANLSQNKPNQSQFVSNELISSDEHSCYNTMKSMYKIPLIRKEKSWKQNESELQPWP